MGYFTTNFIFGFSFAYHLKIALARRHRFGGVGFMLGLNQSVGAKKYTDSTNIPVVRWYYGTMPTNTLQTFTHL